MGFFSIGANLQTLSVYRQSSSQSASGAVVPAWTLSHSLSSIDVQPAMMANAQYSVVLRLFDGDKASVRYQCFAEGTDLDIENGDRVTDPLDSSVTAGLEVANLWKWSASAGMPAHTEFLLITAGA